MYVLIVDILRYLPHLRNEEELSKMVESKITDHPVEFKCSICGKITVSPSPESVALNPNIFPWPAKIIECSVCNQIVCKKCVSDKKKKVCKKCI